MDVSKKKDDGQGNKFYIQQFASILTGYILMIDAGAHLAWTSPALPHLSREKKFYITKEQGSWLASITSLSAIIGIFVSVLLIKRIGSRYFILLFGILHLMTWILINLAYNYTFLFIARLTAGFCLGGTYSFLPPYIGEVSEKRIRGALLAIDKMCVTLGAFFINTLGAFLQYDTMNHVMISLPIIALCLFPLMSESPYYLLMKNQDEKATKTLMKLSGTKNREDVSMDIERIKKGIESKNSESSSFRELIDDRGSQKALIIVILAYTTYAFSGSVAIQAYTQDIFKESGSSLDPRFAAMIIAGIQIFSGLPSTKLIDYWGRRPIYLLSGITSTISLGIVGLFFFLKDFLVIDVSFISWIPLTGLIFYQFACNSGISTLPTVYAGELFSTKVKAVAIMIVLNIVALFLFISKMSLPLLKEAFGMYTAFWLFSSVCLIGPIIIVHITPETKGKNLEEVLALMSMKRTKTNQIC